MKRILITGSDGFIGRFLTRFLCVQGLYDITTVDLKPSSRADQVGLKHVCKDVRQFMKELDDQHQLRHLYVEQRPYDLIIHLAAIPRAGISLQYPESVIRNNVDGLVDVLGYCRTHPSTALLFISDGTVIQADATSSPYALSKHIGEQLIQTYRASYSIKCATLRLFSVFGPGESEYAGDTSLSRTCKKAIWLNQPVEIHGTGNQSRDFTHIDDVVDGISLVIGEMKKNNFKPVYELGAGAPTEVVQVVDAYMKREQNEIVYVAARPGMPDKVCANPLLWPQYWYPQISILDYIQRWKDGGCQLD